LRADLYILLRVEARKSSGLAAVGGADVLDSTSDPYRCGS